MPDDVSSLGTVVTVRDLDEGKMVTVEISEPEILSFDLHGEDLMDARARARALVGAGFAKSGFLRSPDLALEVPRLERRTEVVNKQEIQEDLWSYEIRVRPGFVLE